MSEPVYQKFGVTVADPSAALQTGITAQKANLSEVLKGIEGLMKTQETQYIQQNTQQAQDILKQSIQQRGIGILDNPLDLGQQLRPYGNMIDQAAVTKTVADYTNILKNNFINSISGGADKVFQETNDPIAARNYLHKAAIDGGASRVFADTEAVNYDLRKASEIKNIAIRDAQALDTTLANSLEAAKTGGYQRARAQITEDAKNVIPSKRAVFIKEGLKRLDNEHAKPNEYDVANTNSALAAFDKKHDSTVKVMTENLHDKNDQKVNFSAAHSASSDGGTRRSKNGSSDDTIGGVPLIDSKGKVNGSMSELLGKHVTNLIERLDPNNDSVKIKALYQDVFNAVGDETTTAKIIGQSFKYAYPGNKLLGNDLSAPQLEEMKKKANELVQSHSQSFTGGSTSSSSSSSRGGNVSFTNSDHITNFIANNTTIRQKFAMDLMEAGRNNALGVADGNAVTRVISNYLNQDNQTIPTTPDPKATTAIVNIKGAASASPTSATTNTVPPKANASAPAQSGNQETKEARFARQLKMVKEQEAAEAAKSKNGNTAPVTVPTAPGPTSVVTAPSAKTIKNGWVYGVRDFFNGTIQKRMDEQSRAEREAKSKR